MKSLIGTIVMTAVIFTSGFASVQAQEKSPSAKLTAESLPAFLKEMGLNPETHKPTQGQPICTFQVKEKDGWNFVVEASLTEGSLCLMCPLGDKLPEAESLPPGLLLSLLEANQSTAPCFFTFQAASGCLYMKLEVPSLTPTAQQVHDEMKMLFDTVRQTHVLWKEENWQKGAAQAAPAKTKESNLANTVWNGKENLENYGALSFYFYAGGKVIMGDADGNHQGTYKQQGQTVTLTFNLGGVIVVYSGLCDGQSIRGTAENETTLWNFSVRQR